MTDAHTEPSNKPQKLRVGIDVPANIEWTFDDEETHPVLIHVRASWEAETHSYQLAAVEITRREGGPPITGEEMRALQLQSLLRATIIRNLDRDIIFPTIAQSDIKRLRELGPKPETLEWVARVYTAAELILQPPTKTISELFGLPSRTATHWVSLARSRGYLREVDTAEAEGPGGLASHLKRESLGSDG